MFNQGGKIMKRFLPILITVCLLISIPAFADIDNGEKIFKSFVCNACHQVSKETFGPSLKKIAAVYDGKKEQLVKYFSGKSHPIINPDKSLTMEFTLTNTITMLKKLSDKEKSDLAGFILKHK